MEQNSHKASLTHQTLNCFLNPYGLTLECLPETMPQPLDEARQEQPRSLSSPATAEDWDTRALTTDLRPQKTGSSAVETDSSEQETVSAESGAGTGSGLNVVEIGNDWNGMVSAWNEWNV